jgi:hypothetical protein
MSQRGRNLFDRYVREMLRHPMLAGFGVQSHVYNLLSEARDAQISRAEIEDEAGPLIQALANEMSREEQGGPSNPKD